MSMVTLLFYFLFGPGQLNEMQEANIRLKKRLDQRYSKALKYLIIIDIILLIIIMNINHE